MTEEMKERNRKQEKEEMDEEKTGKKKEYRKQKIAERSQAAPPQHRKKNNKKPSKREKQHTQVGGKQTIDTNTLKYFSLQKHFNSSITLNPNPCMHFKKYIKTPILYLRKTSTITQAKIKIQNCHLHS